jgi:hypothetical protein
LEGALALNLKKVGEGVLKVVECPYILPLSAREEKISNADDISPFESFKTNVSDTLHKVNEKLHITTGVSSAAAATSNAAHSLIQILKKPFSKKKNAEDAVLV